MDQYTKEIFIKSSKTAIIQVVGISARLVTSIFLGRVLGASGLGDVNLINQIITILMVLSMFGMDHVLVKKISIGLSKNNLDAIGPIIFTAVVTNTVIALLLTSLILFFSNSISHFFDSDQIGLPLTISVIILLPQTLGVIFAVAANGFNKVWQSRLLKDFSTSIFVLLGLSIMYILPLEFTLFNVILVYVLSRLLTALISYGYFKKLYHPVWIKSPIDKSMVAMAKPLLFVSATTLLASSIDIIMLGWLSSSKDVGLYTVATRLVLFIAFFLQITNAAISPKIASFYAEGKIADIRNMVNKVTFWLIIIGILSFLFFIILGKPVLGLWGEEFVTAYTALIILCIGQVFNVSTGCSGVLLIMTGNEKVYSYLTGGFLFLNVFLNYILINAYGILGAAYATSFTITLENIVRVIIAKKRTGILTLPNIFKRLE